MIDQGYLPEGSETTVLYKPTGQGAEAGVAERLARIDQVLGKPPRQEEEPDR